MVFKNQRGLYPPFHCDILTGKTVQRHSLFPEVISHNGSLRTNVHLIRLRGFCYSEALEKFIMGCWALKRDQAQMGTH